MEEKKKGVNTMCTHSGSLKDELYKGAASPLYMSTSYAYDDVDVKRYPRYFNTPNQQGLARKIADLEHAEAALVFGSGMAAISTAMLSFLKKGDHIVLQKLLYGGTYGLVTRHLENYGIAYSFTTGVAAADFEEQLRDNTKVIYVESPSNPLLTITDLRAVSRLASSRGIVSMIDNTFASPVNQNPLDFGIDITIHSATKYMGGHSDICAGAIASSKSYIDKISGLAVFLGGNLSDYTVWLLERSIKTMGIRVRAQNENAQKMSEFLTGHPYIDSVYFPGLKTHPSHDLAKSQMRGFGGMLSFELSDAVSADGFQKALKLIKPAMSLAGVESTISVPVKTSHAQLPEEEQRKLGITPGLIRLSLGIEDFEDLAMDIDQAIETSKAGAVATHD